MKSSPLPARLAAGLGRGLEVLLSALLALLTLLAAAETLLWAAFERSHAALPEVQGILLVWFALLGAAYGVHEGLHLALDLLARRLPRPWRIALARLSLALVALFGLLLTFYGAALVGSLVNSLPGTGLPAAVQYWPAVVAGGLIALFALVRLGGGAEEETVEDG